MRTRHPRWQFAAKFERCLAVKKTAKAVASEEAKIDLVQAPWLLKKKKKKKKLWLLKKKCN